MKVQPLFLITTVTLIAQLGSLLGSRRGLGFNPALTDFPLPAFEQGLDIAGLRRDLRALGMVLHEMATGKQPPEDLSSTLRNLPERLAHVIGRCLEQDPESRWQTARDVKAELAWAREPESATTAARPDRRWWTGAGYRTLPPARHRRTRRSIPDRSTPRRPVPLGRRYRRHCFIPRWQDGRVRG